MKKRILSFLFIAVLLLSIPMLAIADSPSNAARNGVVRMAEVFYANDEISSTRVGNAFFVGKEGNNVQYLVTNYHLVQGYLENEKGQKYTFRNEYGTQLTGCYVLYVFFGPSDYVEAYVTDYDESQDIAILKLEKPTDKRIALPLLVPNESMVGDVVYAVGYPSEENNVFDSASNWSTSGSLISKGIIGRLITESGSGTRWIESSDLISSGANGGSPMLTEDGNVIALVSAELNEESTHTGASVEPVIEMLNKNAISYDTAADREKAPDSADESAETAETPILDEQTPEETHEKTPNVWLYAGIGAAAVIVLLVILAAGKKKKKTPEQEEIVQTVPATPQEKPLHPVVHSLSDQHGNQKVYLGEESILVGRSRECKIIYKEGTPGVSGRHCTIAWDAEKNCFIVRDLGSTYGTYLDSGMKLEANKPYQLNAGESFYLGEKDNMLSLEIE